MKAKNVMLLSIVALVAVLSTSGWAHAQAATTTLSDSSTELIIIATVVGSLVAPIFQWATSNANATSGNITPFSWQQYALAIIIVMPISFGLLITELGTMTLTGTGVQATATLFLMAFINGLGINSLKKSIAQASSNATLQRTLKK
jgi:hypothetical protein